MKPWIEIGVAVLIAIIFRDRIVLALMILLLPKSWVRSAMHKAFESFK